MSTAGLFADWDILAAVSPETKDLEEHAEEGKDESQEDECFVGPLLGAGDSWGSVEAAVMAVVILGGKDKCSEPQIREDDIDEQYELAKSRGHERRDEGWQEEYDRHGRNDFLVRDRQSTGTLVDEVGSDTHHNDSTRPLQHSGDELQWTCERTREHIVMLICI